MIDSCNHTTAKVCETCQHENHKEESVQILRELSDALCEWHGECDCYSVADMRRFEYRIDAFLEKYGTDHKGQRTVKEPYYLSDGTECTEQP